MNELIKLTEKKVALLKEYKQSAIYETCLYDVRDLSDGKFQPFSSPRRFLLFEISSKKEVQFGHAGDIRRWLERHKVPEDKVYNYEAIRKPEPKTEDNG